MGRRGGGAYPRSMAQFRWFSRDEITQILDDPLRRRAFLLFCQKEFSLENAVCMMCIGQYQATPTDAKARVIYGLFFDGDKSPHEVNVTSNERRFIYDRLFTHPLPVPYAQLFDRVMTTIKTNLGDTYSRYGGEDGRVIGLAQRVLPTKLGGLGRTLDGLGSKLARTGLVSEAKFVSKSWTKGVQQSQGRVIGGPDWLQSIPLMRSAGLDTHLMCLS